MFIIQIPTAKIARLEEIQAEEDHIEDSLSRKIVLVVYKKYSLLVRIHFNYALRSFVGYLYLVQEFRVIQKNDPNRNYP